MKSTTGCLTAILLVWIASGFWFIQHGDDLGGFLMFFSLAALIVTTIVLVATRPEEFTHESKREL